MTEMYVLQRYLQPEALEQAGVSHFDEWASAFGETVTALELKPEGSGYRLRTRFAKFHNLPELIHMFAEIADIQVAEDLGLPVPKMVTGKPIIEVSQPSPFVRRYIQTLAARAESIRLGAVKPQEDNMLKITTEGKAVAIDARLVDPNAPADEQSKIYRCAQNIGALYHKGQSDRACQLVFLDFGVELYGVMKDVLVSKYGLAPEEIASINEADTETQKAKLFAQCRSGGVRVLFGSTQKMGAGTNLQERLLAVHHLDCPWRPSDIEQRDGRILRQGNRFDEVYIYRYITENTFDAYCWQIQENKQKFITQIMTNKSAVRSADDIDGAVLDCAEVKTLATGDPRIKEKMQLDNDVYALQILKASYLKERVRLQKILTEYPGQLERCRQDAAALRKDMETAGASGGGKDFRIVLEGIPYTERVKAGTALAALLELHSEERFPVGSFRGLSLFADREGFTRILRAEGAYSNKIELGDNALGRITRIENACDALPRLWRRALDNETYLTGQESNTKAELSKPFAREDELRDKLRRQTGLNVEMELSKHTPVLLDAEPETSPAVGTPDREEEAEL